MTRFKPLVILICASLLAPLAIAEELAEIAKVAQPGLVILYHQLFWGSTHEQLLKEMAEIYDGPVVSARDLDVF